MERLASDFEEDQNVKCELDGKYYTGLVTGVYRDHIIVYVKELGLSCRFTNGINIDHVVVV